MKYKLFFLTLILSIFGCMKENEINDPLSLIQEKEPSLTKEIYDNTTNKSNQGIYDIDDLLELLSDYGTNTPNIVPAFNNFYNDVGGGGTYVGNLTLINGERFFDPANQLLIDTTGYTFDWYINNVFQCSETNPQFWDLDNNLDCDGVFELQLIITTPTNAVYSRTQWAYANYNSPELNLPTCDCVDCPSLLNVFYEFYPNVEPYFYQVECSSWDLNCDNTVSISDLLLFLSNFN